MANCVACNAWFEEKKSPVTGEYEVMCPVCVKASNKERQEAVLSAEEREQRPSKEETLGYVLAHYGCHPEISERYEDGLGLMDSGCRKRMLLKSALGRAEEAYDNGSGVGGCIEAAFGTRRFRGNQMEATQGVTQALGSGS